jgi:oxalate decarboxylase/phosphoglucose isomerase-like protein (cupin superfamily)
MLVQPAPVAAQPLRNVFGRIIERGMRVRRFAFGPQAKPATSVKVDVAGEEAARTAEGDLRLQRMVEVFASNVIELSGNSGAQRIRHVHLLS